MKYKRYPKYKDSGVEWLGEIPEHWSEKRFRFLFSFSRGLSITRENLMDIGIPCVNYGDIHSKYGFELNPEKHDLKCVSHEYLISSEKSLLYRGDFIFADTSEDIEGSGNFTCLNSYVKTFAGYHTIIARQKENYNYRYLAYLFDSLEFRSQIRSEVAGVKVFSITQLILKDSKVLLPDPKEQTNIASFLDRETARIDSLIEKKERQIELLKEKRAALISHAVTKGLDPNVKMKDSGVEWLGKIPEHWGVKTLKYIFKNLDYRRIPLSSEERSYMSKNYPYYGASGIIDSVDDYLFDEPLLLVAEDGANLLSRSTSLAFIAEGKYWVNNHAHILKPKSGSIKYWEGILQAYDYTPLITGAAQPKLTADNLGSIALPVPPAKEQFAISSFFSKESSILDGLSDKIQLSINLLNEYRTALISSTVTGKIDVRE
ncbi:restriction endonuclease subunit S [bacterium]|nr:restriction endonuclease subunit S [bacterium]